MLVPRTIPTATGGVPTAQPSAGRALGEAITALRRGEPVLIRDHRVGALAVAAEFVTEGTLHRLREISQGPASLVITRRRAVALGLTPRAELFGAMAIPVSFQLPAAVIRNLGDPAASIGSTHRGSPPSRSLPRARNSPRSFWRSSPRFSPPLSCFAPEDPKPRSWRVQRPRGHPVRSGVQAQCGSRRARSRHRGASAARRCRNRPPDRLSTARWR